MPYYRHASGVLVYQDPETGELSWYVPGNPGGSTILPPADVAALADAAAADPARAAELAGRLDGLNAAEAQRRSDPAAPGGRVGLAYEPAQIEAQTRRVGAALDVREAQNQRAQTEADLRAEMAQLGNDPDYWFGGAGQPSGGTGTASGAAGGAAPTGGALAYDPAMIDARTGQDVLTARGALIGQDERLQRVKNAWEAHKAGAARLQGYADIQQQIADLEAEMAAAQFEARGASNPNVALGQVTARYQRAIDALMAKGRALDPTFASRTAADRDAALAAAAAQRANADRELAEQRRREEEARRGGSGAAALAAPLDTGIADLPRYAEGGMPDAVGLPPLPTGLPPLGAAQPAAPTGPAPQMPLPPPSGLGAPGPHPGGLPPGQGPQPGDPVSTQSGGAGGGETAESRELAAVEQERRMAERQFAQRLDLLRQNEQLAMRQQDAGYQQRMAAAMTRRARMLP